MSNPLIQVTIHTSDATWTSLGARKVILIGGGIVLVAATGGVAAGVILSGGSWAAFGTSAAAAGKWAAGRVLQGVGVGLAYQVLRIGTRSGRLA